MKSSPLPTSYRAIFTEMFLAQSAAIGTFTQVAGRCARLAVLPCCHDDTACDGGGLEGWMDYALAVDAARALTLRSRGYRVWTQTIPAEITPKNRLLLAAPGTEETVFTQRNEETGTNGDGRTISRRGR